MLSDNELKKLRHDWAKMTDQELQKYADDHGVSLKAASSRDGAVDLLEKDAVRKAEAAAAQKPVKQPVKSGGNAKAGRRAMGDELNDEQIAAVQKVWAWWSRNMPFSAQSSGAWEIEKEKRKDGEDHGVPNGDYRVLGADWILTFHGGRFVSAARANIHTRSDSYANVPVQDAKL